MNYATGFKTTRETASVEELKAAGITYQQPKAGREDYALKKWWWTECAQKCGQAFRLQNEEGKLAAGYDKTGRERNSMKYCSEACAAEARREQNRENQRKYRARQRARREAGKPKVRIKRNRL